VLNLSPYVRRALVAVRMGSFRVCMVSGGHLQGIPGFRRGGDFGVVLGWG